MTQSKLPLEWNEERIKRVLEHYETQSEDKAVAEDVANLQMNMGCGE